MKDSITIISSSRMGPGTFEAKFIPLSKVQQVDKIIVARKERGPEISKLSYHVLPSLCKNPFLNLLITPFILARLVKKHKARLLLAYHYIPHFYLVYIAAKFTGTPYILGQTGTDVHRLAALPVRGWFIRRIIKHALFFNVPGSRSQKRWNEMGFDNVHVLHSTIDTERFIPSISDTKEFDFIYIGRLEVYKGLPRIFNAMEELVKIYPDIKMAVVGYGSLEEELKTEVRERGLSGNISFHGFQKDTRAWLHKARIFVMASDNEGLPCALMEAMSCGMVCISS
ncbi:MAG: glycosyltransferase, partial [Candidatus Cloacimonetes bacterium]|nr:glycosyltransferase [Candidatus Cloacimonadota bacterium]